MVLTETEYNQFKVAVIALQSGAVAHVTKDGTTVEYFEKDLPFLLSQISGYEMAHGTTAVRTYAKQIRRR